MKNFILSLLFLLLINPVYSQFPGAKSKEPYISKVDGFKYKVGDEINIGFPSKGEKFQLIGIYNYKSGLTQFNDILKTVDGRDTKSTDLNLLTNQLLTLRGKYYFLKLKRKKTLSMQLLILKIINN